MRTVPRSRRNPQYGIDELPRALAERGIDYRHEPALGGFRKPKAGSPNGGWNESAFQGYADHMTDPDFLAALARLGAAARERPTAIMCAEAQWWRCHRRLIADALTVRGWEVRHLGLGGAPARHELTPFAVVGPDLTLTYPPEQAKLDV